MYAGALALLAGGAALDPEGLRKHVRLREDVRRIAEDNRRLALENARLGREAEALRRDPAALERAAREELRLVRPGEVVYRVEDQAGGSR